MSDFFSTLFPIIGTAATGLETGLPYGTGLVVPAPPVPTVRPA